MSIGAVGVGEAGASQLLLVIEGIRHKPAQIFLDFGGQMGVSEKWEAVLCCLLSASHRHSNVR